MSKYKRQNISTNIQVTIYTHQTKNQNKTDNRNRLTQFFFVLKKSKTF